uniref:Magnesium transporter n=1 Tax=Kwoniella dejecticola CBS 10117 TaxID=1296121 RepID=A0A1A6A197_9TREE|nr:magnesium transporter [Kwoniella dejecticola CBS 10117]OBR83833.1 magnesium transporter [Kwoniella dejecticola CBS 10117]
MPDRTPTSPRQIQIDPHLPQPVRNMSITSPTTITPSRQSLQHRNSHGGPRSYRPMDDADARQRQMQQDIESAMSMSRARSGSLADTSPPVVRPSAHHFPSTSPIEEGHFPMLSDAEEAEMNRARYHGGADNGSDDGHPHGRSHYDVQEDQDEHSPRDRRPDHHGHSHGQDDGAGGSSGYDSHSRLLGRRGSDGDQHRIPMDRQAPDLRSMGGMGGIARNRFDFAAMEEYANKERENLFSAEGAWAINPNNNGGGGGGFPRRRSTPNKSRSNHGSEENINQPGSYDTANEPNKPMFNFDGDGEHGADDSMTEGPFSPPARTDRSGSASLGGEQNFHRRRQRKLSQSNPVLRRQGKLALFEGFGSSSLANGADGEVIPETTSTAFKAPRSGKNQNNVPLYSGGPSTGFIPYSDNAPGHDRPYRFSFYSNAMPVTIHARSLAELPAEGQSFEELFKGKNQSSSEKGSAGTGTPSKSGNGNGGSGTETPINQQPMEPSTIASKTSMLSRAIAGHQMSRDNSKTGAGGGGNGDGTAVEDDPEQFTWWLDVLSPTDEEMRMLSRVFGIHPLTTEDILLEETREKIELFRNYYLVCFRSFDQDPYSQTYLEPLNMYIIVFREGTLSFHFRGTPHPQNVRRRIKHLKDYISVTSDWISYALIDDITDAFGPLIQSIEYEVDSIDELVLILKEAEQSDMLRRIGTCRKKVMGLLRLMGNKADVVKGLAKRCNEQWLVAPKSDIGLYLSDIQDHLITMTQNLNHYEKILSRSHSNYLAQISIEMTDANNQINDVLSKLTALGTVLIPMNLVTGLWGMNVHVPGEGVEGLKWFGGILGCLAAFAVLGAWATVSPTTKLKPQGFWC